MEEIMKNVQANYSDEELTKYTRSLYDNYSLFNSEEELKQRITTSTPLEWCSSQKMNAHEFINYMVKYYFQCECIIKAAFIRKNVHILNEVTFFEMNLGNSRLDLARVNGKSKAYEIKTEYDNLSKLDRQVKDYSKAFEYVYVIAHECHYSNIIRIIPDYCGLILYKVVKGEVRFHYKKKASKSPNLDTVFQLKNLTKKDILKLIQGNNLHYNNKYSKEELLYIIVNSKINVNSNFKKIIKSKYTGNWMYLKENLNKVNDIDLQFFFKSKLDPDVFYS